MDEERCEQSDLPKAWCAHCRGIGAPEEELSAEEEFLQDMEKK